MLELNWPNMRFILYSFCAFYFVVDDDVNAAADDDDAAAAADVEEN